MTASRRSILPVALLLLTAAPGCDLLDDKVPHGQASGDVGTTTGDSSGPGISATVTGDVTEGGLGYGEPCELGPPQAWEETAEPPGPDDVVEPQATVLAMNEACAGEMCLLVYDDSLPPSCETDADCGTPDAKCSAGQCVLQPAYVAEHARCTMACEDASECAAIPGCETGVACVIMSKLGPSCCEKVCACNDALSAGRADMLEQECAQGFEGCS